MAGHSKPFNYPRLIPYRSPRNTHILRHKFRLFRFRSPLTYGISVDFFSRPYLDVSVRDIPLPLARDSLKKVGFPIWTPSDQCFLAAPRRLSRPSTSFFGLKFQLGIHYLLYGNKNTALLSSSLHFSKYEQASLKARLGILRKDTGTSL